LSTTTSTRRPDRRAGTTHDPNIDIALLAAADGLHGRDRQDPLPADQQLGHARLTAAGWNRGGSAPQNDDGSG